ncbi:hypothetical protein SDC9_181477 [bioreactor metagenome]|uniref:Uncharacterized protein n=2 Tax=root TaxID=1 RepID=A0A645H4P4_9ZZZZ
MRTGESLVVAIAKVVYKEENEDFSDDKNEE